MVTLILQNLQNARQKIFMMEATFVAFIVIFILLLAHHPTPSNPVYRGHEFPLIDPAQTYLTASIYIDIISRCCSVQSSTRSGHSLSRYLHLTTRENPA